MAALITDPAAKLVFDEPERGWVVAETATHRWMLRRMVVNVRLVCMPLLPVGSGDLYGWCYHNETTALRACLLFDPDVHDEPVGWHKRSNGLRRAPRREEQPEYNRPRCQHGTYIHEGYCTADLYCSEARWPDAARSTWVDLHQQMLAHDDRLRAVLEGGVERGAEREAARSKETPPRRPTSVAIRRTKPE